MRYSQTTTDIDQNRCSNVIDPLQLFQIPKGFNIGSRRISLRIPTLKGLKRLFIIIKILFHRHRSTLVYSKFKKYDFTEKIFSKLIIKRIY
jgi:hypothetical protein